MPLPATTQPTQPTPRRWPQATLRTYLVAIILIATLPLAGLTLFRTVVGSNQDREVLLSNMRSTTRAVARVVELELRASQDLLAALGQAETLQRGDLAGFESGLRFGGPWRASWSHLALLSADGRLLVEMKGAAEDTAAGAAPAEFAALASTMAAQSSGRVLLSVFDGVPAAGRSTWIGVRGQAASGAPFLLAARVALSEWQSLLESSAPEGSAYLTLFDAQHRVLARTLEPERFTSASLPAAAVAGMGSAPSGWQRTELLGSGETYVAWQMLRDADWGVGVGIALAEFESAQNWAMLWALGVSALCLLLGVCFSLRVARRVAEPLQRLLQRRTGAPRQTIAVTEIAQLRDAFEASENEREKLMAREQLARHAAAAASRAKDELLPVLGHALRNPLNAIVTSSEVLRNASPGSDIAESAREVLARQTRRLTLLIDDLLDMGRVMSDDATLALQPLELQGLVRAGVMAAMPRAETRKLRLTLQAGDPVWVRGDARRIGQVMAHLLDNAIKRTTAGGTIAASLAVVEGQAAVRVEDRGPGADNEPMPSSFEPFVAGLHGLDVASGGMGLGVALVRRLVELHGGSLQAQTSPHGSSFEWRLPVIAAPAGAGPATLCRVGLIDDNPDVLASLRAMLELAGHDVVTAADGLAGVSMLLAERPEVALVDIGLSGIDGYELVRRCRAAGFSGRIFAITGHGEAKDRQRSAAEGFDAHLVKPVEPERLLSLLRGV